MKTRLNVLYIPGLGDAKVTSQRLAIITWRLWGVDAEVIQMRWADQSEDWETKFSRLLNRIDELAAADVPIGLVGSSAGATAVLNAYAIRKTQIAACVLIAGKVNYPDTIGERLRRENPAFYRSAQDCENAIKSLSPADRQRILSRYAIFDGRVRLRDSLITGANNHTVPTFGHSITIATQLIFGAPGFLRFIKRIVLNKTET